jgi:hypothetical protein
MKFELITKNYTTFNILCDRVLFNPVIQSVIFDDGFKILVYLEKSKLADFASIIKDLDVGISEDTAINRLK